MKKIAADKGVSAAHNKICRLFGEKQFCSAKIIGENILRSMLAKSYYTILQN